MINFSRFFFFVILNHSFLIHQAFVILQTNISGSTITTTAVTSWTSSSSSSSSSTLLKNAMSDGKLTTVSTICCDVPSTTDDSDFTLIIDDFGCPALESHKVYMEQSGGELERWIRIQSTPDLPPMTREQILEQIRNVEIRQARYDRSDLYPRDWIWKDPDDSSSSFSVLQFNILAQGLSFGPNTQPPFEPTQKLQEFKAKNTYGGFTAVKYPDICFDFDFRRWRILQAILDANCDVIVLEEIDRFYGFFLPMLRQFGYEGHFVPKVHAPGVKLGWYSDGCAIFYRTSVFDIDTVNRHIFEVGNQVCLISQLCHKTTGERVQIAATHLKAGQSNNECSAMRELQVDELLHFLSKTSHPVVLGGDFNAEPYTKAIKKIRKVYSSAYDLSDPNLLTTCKIRGNETKKRTIDYLFFSKQLECTAVWDIPHKEVEEEKLPSLRYPSDHVLIAAKFKFIPKA